MPKFNITVSFDLTTEVEPEVSRHFWDTDGVSDFSDESYFQRAEVESSGGDLKFKVEAEDEDAAREIAESVIQDGSEVEDDNGLTWLVENLDIDIEEVEEMTKEQAVAIVQRFIETQIIDAEVKAALILLISLI